MNKVCSDKHELVRGNVHFPPDVGLDYALKIKWTFTSALSLDLSFTLLRGMSKK